MTVLDIWNLFSWNYCECEIRKVCITGPLILSFSTESVVLVVQFLHGYFVHLALVVHANLLKLQLLTVFNQIWGRQNFEFRLLTKDTISRSFMTPKYNLTTITKKVLVLISF